MRPADRLHSGNGINGITVSSGNVKKKKDTATLYFNNKALIGKNSNNYCLDFLSRIIEHETFLSARSTVGENKWDAQAASLGLSSRHQK